MFHTMLVIVLVFHMMPAIAHVIALATVLVFVTVHVTAHVIVPVYLEVSDNRFSSSAHYATIFLTFIATNDSGGTRVNTLGCLTCSCYGYNECGREICEDMR